LSEYCPLDLYTCYKACQIVSERDGKRYNRYIFEAPHFAWPAEMKDL